MVGNFLSKIFGSRNQRLVKRMLKVVSRISALEEGTEALTDEQLRARTEEFRQRLAAGERLDDMLHEVFAVVREAGKRILKMRHFDVQLVGGMVLNQGKIAEMRTGEGKTLVATLAVYLNALPGKGVHVVTVNDYLARRDAAWMGKIYHFLGMSVGVINSSGGWDRTHLLISTIRQQTASPAVLLSCVWFHASKPMTVTSLTEPTMSLASTICATTWLSAPISGYSVRSTSQWWTRLTRSLSMRRELR